MVQPDANGYFGEFGGRFVPETLMDTLLKLEQEYARIQKDTLFAEEFQEILKNYVGRPTPLYFAANLTRHFGGAKIYLKREDLTHTGAHKINNTVGQALLAKAMGKKNIIAETGAGQHGVATATVAALLGMKCKIFMGQKDIERQALNVFKMKMLGSEVIPCLDGSQSLKEAVNAAFRYWMSCSEDHFYVLGTVTGPHPYPMMVRDFQSVIGYEVKQQIMKAENKLPDLLLACIGGGSNAIGLFYPFLKERTVKKIGVEAAGEGLKTRKYAATLNKGQVGIFHGTKSRVLQDENHQIMEAHSISAGLDYPGVGPEHAYLHESKQVQYLSCTDEEALEAVLLLTRTEGIIPAMESAHALAHLSLASRMRKDQIVVLNLSGRGDKDMGTFQKAFAL